MTEDYRSGRRGGGSTSECRSASLAVLRVMCPLSPYQRLLKARQKNVMPPSLCLLILPMGLAIGCLWQLTRHAEK
ncbi:hypothetical protein LY76DRAFT_343501 [Colletotrichum caudatum]|nr:hypothetical protein LY76DRAFT_343501 [Colletotrichum caudatum]